MRKLDLKDFREIASLHENACCLKTWNDDDLLKAHLGYDLGLDSLDIIDMVAEIERDYNVIINSEAFDEKMYPAATEATVQKFLDVCNECLKSL